MQEAQAIAVVEVQPTEAADLPHTAERAVQPQASGPDPLDGDGPVPMITVIAGVPLAIFLYTLEIVKSPFISVILPLWYL